MRPGRAVLFSGALFVIGIALLGGGLLASRAAAESLGLAMVLIIPAGVVAVLIGAGGLLFGLVAYIVGSKDPHVE